MQTAKSPIRSDPWSPTAVWVEGATDSPVVVLRVFFTWELGTNDADSRRDGLRLSLSETFDVVASDVLPGHRSVSG